MTFDPLPPIGASAVLILYFAAAGLLVVHGLHYLVVLLMRLRPRRPRHAAADWTPLPSVTVQVPVHNERFVLADTIQAVARLDWPRDRIQVQIIDDSTDDTSEIAADLVARHRARGLDIVHLIRADRRGYKAGALQHGLATARGDLVAVFDADFLPPSDFLKKAVRGFDGPRVASVQARWTHRNEGYSWLTRAIALGIDTHFAIEQTVRDDRGFLLSFNGTAVVWRRAAIDACGGWSDATLAEDLDLSVRARASGWTFRYLADLEVPQEIPVEMTAFRRQQYRWAKGSIQNARLHARRILASPLRRPVKVETLFHLTHYTIHPLVFALFLAQMLLPLVPAVPAAFSLLFVLATTTGPVGMFVVAQSSLYGPGGWRRALRLIPLSLIGIGVCASNTRAILAGLFTQAGRFDRTPKYGIGRPGVEWKGTAYALSAGGFPWVETALSGFACLGAWVALDHGRAMLALADLLFALAFALSAYASLRFP